MSRPRNEPDIVDKLVQEVSGREMEAHTGAILKYKGVAFSGTFIQDISVRASIAATCKVLAEEMIKGFDPDVVDAQVMEIAEAFATELKNIAEAVIKRGRY